MVRVIRCVVASGPLAEGASAPALPPVITPLVVLEAPPQKVSAAWF